MAAAPVSTRLRVTPLLSCMNFLSERMARP
jgi:hypothetical protein